ncbi:MAG: multi-sensor signal transduction histidine kinase [Candidatus Acidoferrum typicum]|nr:multi-sensor signal transduction histidine kinase [Candidatus Acidoferrum typicum]
MSGSNAPGKLDSLHTSIPEGVVPLEAVLCTEELQRRPARPPDHEKENRALVALARALAESPRTILQLLADTILEVFEADSAGLSLLTTHDGGKRFYWPAIAGRWKPHIGGGTPRDFGPCGDVLDRNAPLLFRHFELRYTYFLPVTPPVEECLLVPFYVEGKAVGTIWAIAHDERRKFDAEDERLLSSIGTFASSAYQIHTSIEAVTVEMTERQNVEAALRQRTAQFEILLNEAPLGVHLVDADFKLRHANPTAVSAFGNVSDLIGRDFGEVIHTLFPTPQANEIVERFRHTLETGEQFFAPEWAGERLDRPSREIYEWQISRIPLPDGRYGVVCYFRDISSYVSAREILRANQDQLRALTDTLESQVRARTMELEKQSELLRELSQRLMQAQDDERRRIARELHDSLGQVLAALGMNLGTVAQHAKQSAPQLVRIAGEGQHLVQQLDQELRTMSYLLHPPLLDESGLSQGLRWYIRGLKERSGLNTALSIPEDFGRLSREMELAMFRVVQECLMNVHRHAESTKATVRIARDDKRVYLEVQDEGKGMPPDRLRQIQSHGSGVGITGMRERVRQLNGHLEIVSDRHGTKVSVTFPSPKIDSSG